MKGHPTSYTGMFSHTRADGPAITAVEIPLIQRDYAQGRSDPRAVDIRNTFLDALLEALVGGEPMGLDFVYGEVNDGTFEPLDGQQRLTTLFLLHWYLAFRSGRLGDSQPWVRLTYATRPSARLFCERIVENSPPEVLLIPPSRWIEDQQWYLYIWQYDPTIRAMLVMLDAIADRFKDVDAAAAWERLTDETNPAVWFQLLPIAEMGSAEDLYLKMNSRGKPLTPFEEFKARFGQIVAHTGRADEFGQKIDGAWADLMWSYRGDNDLVDDEFMRYYDFVLEICEWHEGKVQGGVALRLERRAQALFGATNPIHNEHLAFFFAALDVWVNEAEIRAAFEALFTVSAHEPGRVRLFGAATVDLFASCCERYGATRGDTRAYSLTDTLLLYATLIQRISGTNEAARRLRQLRNVNEASQFELRLQNMPKFVAEVRNFMHSGSLEDLATFNQNQVADEQRKQQLREDHAELETAVERLEDHPILRGTLVAFDLSSTDIAARAAAFEEAFAPEHWPMLTGALLAMGEYQQRESRDANGYRFGSPTIEGVWRTVLVGRGDSGSLASTRGALGDLLDRLAASPEPVKVQLKTIVDGFLTERRAEKELDWRYYLVRYACMREGTSGIYYGANGKLGYKLTMLQKKAQNSWYRDPYLYAIWLEGGGAEAVVKPWFTGKHTIERWMRLERSHVGLRSVEQGIALQPPILAPHRTTFEALCAQHSHVAVEADDWLLRVAQEQRNGEFVDTEDRVQKAASFLRELVAAGL